MTQSKLRWRDRIQEELSIIIVNNAVLFGLNWNETSEFNLHYLAFYHT